MFVGWIGILLAGCISGSFTVPSRSLRVMPWDGAWLIYCTVAKLLVPCLLGLWFATPIFSRVLPQHPGLAGMVLVAGLSFGCGSFLFGACVQRLGVALSNAIVSGTVALVGSLSPLVTGTTQLSRRDWNLLLWGLLTLAAGIAASCLASILRDRSRPQQQVATPATTGALAGVLLALLAGCLSSMLNAGFVSGRPLMDFAIQEGVQPAFASLAVWIPVLGGGFIVNVIATNLRLARLGGYSLLACSPGSDWLRAAAMGILWSSAILIYGVCTQILGSTGTVYGWALMVAASILISIVWGIWLGEWTLASARARSWLFASLALILASLFILSIRET